MSALMLFTGCAKVDEDIPVVTTTVTEPPPMPYPVTIGSLVFNNAPESTASLSPAITEIIYELGFADSLTGRSEYCTYPETAEKIAVLGSAANPDVEAIIKNSPQLLISQSPIAKKDITAIESADTRVLIIPAPSSVEELSQLYSSIYRVFTGDNDDETEIISSCFSKLEASFEKNHDLLESYVYLLSDDLSAASDNTFAGNFFSHFGTNCAANTDGNIITAEELLNADPQWLILPPYMSQESLPEELLELTAISEGHIITLDEETATLLERPTSRIYLTAEYICNAVNSADTPSETENPASEE